MAGVRPERILEAYRNVFTTEDGQIVLADVLSQLGYFANREECIKPPCIAVANTIISRCGLIGSDGTGLFMEGIGHAIQIAGMNWRYKEEDDEDI